MAASLWTQALENGWAVRGLLKQHDAVNASRLNLALVEYRNDCGRMTVSDVDLAIKKVVDEVLWDFHSKVNAWYRRAFGTFKVELRRPPRSVERRKLLRHYLRFIKDAQSYYRSQVHLLISRHEGSLYNDHRCKDMDRYRQIIAKFPKDRQLDTAITVTGPNETAINTPDTVHTTSPCKSVKGLCYNSIVHLGDLSRWREQEHKTEGKEWKHAFRFYDLAVMLDSTNGKAFNMLGALHLYQHDWFTAAYFFYRAVTARTPFAKAMNSLQICYMATSDGPPDEQAEGAELVPSAGPFLVHIHGRYVKGRSVSDDDQTKVAENMILVLDEGDGKTAHRMVLSNIAAEWIATEEWKNKHEPLLSQIHIRLSELNVRTFSTILQVILFDLGAVGSGDMKLSELTPIVPLLREYSSWLFLHASYHHKYIDAEVKLMWSLYSGVLSEIAILSATGFLCSSATVEELEATKGFKPLLPRGCQGQVQRWHKETQHNAMVMAADHDNYVGVLLSDFLEDGHAMLEVSGSPLRMHEAIDNTEEFFCQDLGELARAGEEP